jgi:hypothetical protein
MTWKLLSDSVTGRAPVATDFLENASFSNYLILLEEDGQSSARPGLK